MEVVLLSRILTAAKKADAIYRACNTRDPHRIAKELGLQIIYAPFQHQYGAYKVLLRNRFVFLKEGLDPIMENAVLFHETGHDQLHRHQAVQTNGFEEFSIFGLIDSHMEIEANAFAAQLSISDNDFIEFARQGFDIQQIGNALHAHPNLVAFKSEIMKEKGFQLVCPEFKKNFLISD